MPTRPARPASGRPSVPRSTSKLAAVAAVLSDDDDRENVGANQAAAAASGASRPARPSDSRQRARRPGAARPPAKRPLAKRPPAKRPQPSRPGSLVDVAKSVESEERGGGGGGGGGGLKRRTSLQDVARDLEDSVKSSSSEGSLVKQGAAILEQAAAREASTVGRAARPTTAGRGRGGGGATRSRAGVSDARRDLGPGPDKRLQRAALRGRLSDMRSAMRDGADPDLPDVHGWTALHYAASCTLDEPDLIRILVNEGSDLEFTDTLNGWTPLHVAAVKGNYESARALLDAGAKKNVRSQVGELPVNCVRRARKNTRLFEALTTSRRQLESWPEAWLDSELRGRGGNGGGGGGAGRRIRTSSEDSVFNDDDESDRRSARSSDDSDVFEDEDG